MPLTVTSAYRGRTAIIILQVYDEDNNRTDSDSLPVISIRRSESSLVPPVVQESMLKFDLGGYKYYWDTTNVSPGVYTIIVSYKIDGHPQVLKTPYTVVE